jgi:hypothetical protein
MILSSRPASGFSGTCDSHRRSAKNPLIGDGIITTSACKNAQPIAAECATRPDFIPPVRRRFGKIGRGKKLNHCQTTG